ncbi:MAG: serine/threonine protein kinase [Pyrinomonadaceae bacterium]|nr:serine/threonine protein kinase [Phycisphaerales bacterium]
MAELGRGAASIIYLVQDAKSKHVWALKHVTKETPKDQRFLDQAEAEYEVASKLDHPRIRKISKLIKKKQNLLSVSDLWLVMEVVDGASLEREPPTTFEDAAGIFEQVARGMAYMHSQGYVHADMKPNNIIVNDQGECKIIDLGQSCKIGTVKERIQGTPDYIAPEQVHRRAINERTDIYNLGATMYWVLTRNFVPTALARGDSLVGSKDDHMLEKPKRLTEHNSRVPELFDRLVMQCVEIDSNNRPKNMLEVADRLNFIYAKLLAEQELRKSGMLPRYDDMPRQPPPVGASSGAGNGSQIGNAEGPVSAHGDSVDLGDEDLGDLPTFDSFDEGEPDPTSNARPKA